MQIKDLRPEPYVKQLRCDRCGLLAEVDGIDCESAEFFSIETKAGYGSIFGDGNNVEVDLCQHCVKAVLGEWLRVSDQEVASRELQARLDGFDPERPNRPHWNLRVIQFEAGEDSYAAVHEVYYAADGRPRAYASTPAVLLWTLDDEPGAAQRRLQMFQRALAEPPLKEDDFKST